MPGVYPRGMFIRYIRRRPVSIGNGSGRQKLYIWKIKIQIVNLCLTVRYRFAFFSDFVLYITENRFLAQAKKIVFKT